MSLLAGFRVVQIGDGLAAAVCGRLFADVGADVACIDPDNSTPLADYLNHGKSDRRRRPGGGARGSRPDRLRRPARRIFALDGYDAADLRRLNPTAALVFISPFGQTGPQANDPATDLTLFFASGMARLLTGQVDDLAEPPIRPVGEQSAFIGGLAAACAGMHAALAAEPGAVIDVSIQEALATMAIGELARAGLGGKIWSRRRLSDGNGATVTILPARDGYAAISPREDRQWASWLEVMGSPDWGGDPRFATKPDRVANWDALHALMSAWSRQHDKQWIADQAQAAHVPSFPLREPAEQLASPQLAHRDFWRRSDIGGRTIKAPGPPFGLRITHAGHDGTLAPPDRCRSPAFACSTSAGSSPARRRRAISRRWAPRSSRSRRPAAATPAAPPNCTRCSARPSAASSSTSRKQEAVAVAQALAAKSDVLIENFATGVMERLGLGAEALRALNPDLIYVSASGLGRTGPEAHAVAYGTLLQCYAGFAGLNRHPDVAAADRLCLARPDVRPDARLHRRRRRCGIGDGPAGWRASISR